MKLKGRLMSLEEFRAFLAAECQKAGGQEAFSEKTGISQSYISQILNGRQEPGPSVLAALEFEKVVLYRRSK